MATNNNAKIKKGYVLLFKTPKDDYIKDPYVEVCLCYSNNILIVLDYHDNKVITPETRDKSICNEAYLV